MSHKPSATCARREWHGIADVMVENSLRESGSSHHRLNLQGEDKKNAVAKHNYVNWPVVAARDQSQRGDVANNYLCAEVGNLCRIQERRTKWAERD